jgi:hypothetical protein
MTTSNVTIALQSTQYPIPIVNQPYLAINDLLIKIPTEAGASTIFTVGPGQCRDQTNTNDINLGSWGGFVDQDNDLTTTVDLSLSGLNGLDVGTVAANKVYYVYVIAALNTPNLPGVVASLATPDVGPTLPIDYQIYRLIGHVITDSSSKVLFGYHSGNSNSRTFTYDAPQATAVTAGNATTYTDVALDTLVPSDKDVPVYVSTAFTPGAAGRTLSLQASGSVGDQVTITGQVTSVVVTSLNKVIQNPVDALPATKPTIAYKVSNSGDAVAINVAGFDYFV